MKRSIPCDPHVIPKRMVSVFSFLFLSTILKIFLIQTKQIFPNKTDCSKQKNSTSRNKWNENN